MAETQNKAEKGPTYAETAANEGPKPSPDQPILDFEEKLKDPMLPDWERANKKVKKKFPVIWQKFGGATALIFVLMYAAIGFNGVLVFVLGMISVVVLIGVAIFLYIVNENERARAHRIALQKEQDGTEEDFVQIDSDLQ